MRPPSPLPPPFIGAAFTTAHARANGVPPWRLRSSDIEHPFHGVNVLQKDDAASESEAARLCDDYIPRLRRGLWFSHTTAALLFSVPLPLRMSAHPLHVSVRSPRTPPRTRGVVGHKVSAHVILGVSHGRFPTCSPADVWCQLATVLRREDLVAAGDHLLGSRSRDPLTTLDELRAASTRYSRGRGALTRAWALERIRVGADSRPESLLRLQLVGYGVPEPLVNAPVRSTMAGKCCILICSFRSRG